MGLVDSGSDAVAEVLEQIKEELLAVFDGGITRESILVDVDVFDGEQIFTLGRELDSMDLVLIVGALEARFDLELAPLLTGDEPVTLRAVARHIAGAR